MVRLKKPACYIEELCSQRATQKVGKLLRKKYSEWTLNLGLKDFLDFIETIRENKDDIGAAQFFGKFRAYSFEEYVYRLIKARVPLPRNLEVYWGEKCLVWKDGGREYGMEVDVTAGRETGGFVAPVVAVDTKVELDASRLKTALASFTLLKDWNPKVKCFLVYVEEKVDQVLLQLSKRWVDGAYNFGLGASEVQAFLESVRRALRQD